MLSNIFKNLGFTKRNGKIVAPDSAKLGGFTLTEIKNMIKSDIGFIDNTIDGHVSILGSTLPNSFQNTYGWGQYQAKALNIVGSLFINNELQVPESEIGDKYYTNTKLLLDGNTISDKVGRSITNYGITVDTENKKYGTGSLYFNGSSYLKFPNNIDLAFGTGPFTIEFSLKSGTVSNDKFILNGRGGIGVMHITTGGYNGTLLGGLRYVGSSEIISNVVITNNVWNNCAIVRDNNSNVKLFVNGALVGSGTDTTNYTGTTGDWFLGSLENGGLYFTGNMDNIRITKGIARYTSNYTVSADEFLYEKVTTIFKRYNSMASILNVTCSGTVDNIEIDAYNN